MAVYEIYMAECPEGRRYVGCTKNGMHTRWGQHRVWNRPWPGDDKACIADAIARFGRDAFKLTVLATTEHVEIAKALETALIEHCGALSPKGYNKDRRSNIAVHPYVGPHWTVGKEERERALIESFRAARAA